MQLNQNLQLVGIAHYERGDFFIKLSVSVFRNLFYNQLSFGFFFIRQVKLYFIRTDYSILKFIS